jgi:DNA polymerase
MGVGPAKKWERIESYGPKFVENIIQAIARDILCYAMRTLSDCSIVAHVHDELIIECPMETEVQEICDRMGRTPPWGPGLLLRADGYECTFYKKD